MFIQHSSALTYRPKKIISLVPSQTELLFDLGLDEAVAGITKFCIHPAEWRKRKTIVGGTKQLHLEKIKVLNPDLVIANKEENTKEQIDLLSKDFPVWVTDVTKLDEALMMINNIGVLTKSQTVAANIINQIQKSFSQIQPLKNKSNTCYFIWQEPYMTVGRDTFIHDMMKRCGFNNIFADQNRYPVVTIEDLKERHCELLLLSSEPFPFKQQHLERLQQQLPSVKFLLVDGAFFSWYGSRLINAPAYFDAIINHLNY